MMRLAAVMAAAVLVAGLVFAGHSFKVTARWFWRSSLVVAVLVLVGLAAGLVPLVQPPFHRCLAEQMLFIWLM